MLAAPPAPVVVLAYAIAGVPLGATRAGLTSRLGAGLVVRHGRNEFGSFADVNYARRSVTVGYVQGVAVRVSTRSDAYPTRRGVAAGDSTARLRAVYGDRLRCMANHTCTLGKALPGHAVTTFQLERGSIVRITVAAVVD